MYKVSAPGKVLLAGGYLVLDRPNRGLVISTSARFYCQLHRNASSEPLFHFKSPQFSNGDWSFRIGPEFNLIAM
jgi:phosphomevalonate kinase